MNDSPAPRRRRGRPVLPSPYLTWVATHAPGTDPETCTVQEAAQRLGVHANTVRRMADRPADAPGYLRSYRVNPGDPGSPRRIYVEAVEAVIQAREAGEVSLNVVESSQKRRPRPS